MATALQGILDTVEANNRARQVSPAPAPIASPVKPPPEAWVLTHGLPNGRAWLEFYTQDQKAVFITGVYAGLRAGGGIPEKYDARTLSWNEVIEGVTQVYKASPAFGQIPVPAALRIFLAYAHGAQPDSINAEIRDALTAASASE